MYNKTSFVQGIFSYVSKKYDLMNDIMSFGTHRAWKNHLINMMQPKQNDVLLDLAGGTGDIAFRFLKKGGGKVIVADLNEEMLKIGQERSFNNWQPEYKNKIEWVHANAEELPFDDETFSCCSIVFGIRNVTHIDKALSEICRVLKPSGKLFCMEFDNLDDGLIKTFCNPYYKHVIPQIGKIITGDAAPYEYLTQSIMQFPKPEDFRTMIANSGLHNICDVPTFPAVARTYIAYK